MKQIFLPYKPRREDEIGHMIVQQNVDELLKLLNGVRSLMYVGMCVPWPGDHANFTGSGLVWADDAELWAWCNGHTSMSKVVYPELYEFLGTVYSVDASNFKLPNYTNGQSPIGKGANFTTVAATGGERTHAPTLAETFSHTHPWGSIRASIPTRGAGGSTVVNAVVVISDWDGVTRFDPPSNGSTDPAGGSNAFNVMDPYQVAGGWVILTRDPLGE